MAVTRVPVSVETRAPAGETAACLFGANPALLVDPGATSERLDELVAARDVGHLAVTHHHGDHVGAIATYAERCDPTVWGRLGRCEAFAAATGVTPDRAFADGTTIPTGGEPVRVIDTPGHAPEHVAFSRADTLACGDLAVADGSVAVAAPEGDMRAYLSSARRVYAMGADRLVPAHGPELTGSGVRQTLRRLIDHRLAREQRVRKAVAAGGRTVSEIREQAYDKDLSGVQDLANGTIRAHLEKLAVESRVHWDGRRAAPPPTGPACSKAGANGDDQNRHGQC
jgi:ribonuclease/clavin/mitogillin